MASTMANFLGLIILDGEPAWICLLSCKIDIVFSAFVIHWMTQKSSVHSTLLTIELNAEPEYFIVNPFHRSSTEHETGNVNNVVISNSDPARTDGEDEHFTG
ncbi:uncharacterized protein BCR38DRAFT_396811 [Pseudomassariella vexata]|uniref:Uncharacterized protein n=1 Tax=Pseudomassariella vexata TaxID=1141098 RepID=A0A1Y2DR42_9PEZI|nr:uncharacterized protein BCR38DRAFT_396811 [Pseudomassariella vexata]ORY61731.1 hypothetical protein BCR38DRAFT_396811 [Pseudomassariella vexata]